MALRREWVGLVLVLLGLLRAGVLVAHDPIMGYGNSYDMVRTTACLGLAPDKADPDAPSPDGPIPIYKVGERRWGGCYLSTEVAIDAGAMAVARMAGKGAGEVRLAWIGYAKLTLLAVTALLIAFALHANPLAAFVHGLVVLLVVADPVSTLWFNTFYTEFGAIAALYAVIASACTLAVTSRGKYAMWTVLAAGVAALAFSREQYALLGPLMVLASWPWLWRRSAEMTVATFIAALACALVSFTVVPRPGVVTHVNRADTYMGVLLPASTQPKRALQVLGLPARCETLIGATWYLQRGESLRDSCPEVFLVPSYAFLRFVTEEPEALVRSVARVLPAMYGLSPGYLGTSHGAKLAGVGVLPVWSFSPLFALSVGMPMAAFISLVVVAMLAALLAFLAAIAWARPADDRPHAALLLGMLLGGSVIYGFATAVFGDGLSEAARHFIPGALAMYVLLIAALAAIPALAAHWWEAPKAHAFEIAAGFAAVPVVLLACVMAWRWAQPLPLAIGVLDLPRDRQGTLPALQIRGWALDPFGVDSVQVELGALRREARIGGESLALRSIYPGYPDGARGGFALDLGEEDLRKAGAPEALPMRITVRSRAGGVTEIDRRRLEFPK
ncbi:MAG: hypothetical protein ABI789_03940 [Usitatibacter sp.]